MADNFNKVTHGLSLDGLFSPPANPLNGDIYYDKSLNKFQKYENGQWTSFGSGSGGAGKDYLTNYNNNTGNGDFELNSTTGWSLFHTTMTGVIPTGAITAGAASITTFDTVTSGQLAAKASLRAASSGAWAAGAGFISDAFTIDKDDQAKVLGFNFVYSVISGAANLNLSGTSSNTFAVYLYDVTNSTWIQPAGVYNLIQNSGVGNASGTFQTSPNGTQYRIAVLAVNTSAGAASVYWDDFHVGPQVIVAGAAITDWVAYTPTFNNLTVNPGATFVFSRRVGDSLEVQGTFTPTSSSPAVAEMSLGFNGVSGNVFTNPSKISDATVIGDLGRGDGTSSATGPYSMYVLSSTGSPGFVHFGFQSTTVGPTATPLNANVAFNNVFHSFYFKIPIAGWSSNSVMSGDTDTRVVAMTAILTSAQTPGAGGALIYDTAQIDTHGAYNNSTGEYTVPVSGIYVVNIANLVSTTNNNFVVYKNGAFFNEIGLSLTTGGSGQLQLSCLAGDKLKIVSVQGTATIQASPGSYLATFDVRKLSGPATIAVGETVAIDYYLSANNAYTTNTVIPFDTKTVDTHGAFSSGVFTVPVSGIYRVSGVIQNNTGGAIALYISKNGSTGSKFLGGNGGEVNGFVSGSRLIQCVAGDTISLRANASVTIVGGAGENSSISISRAGN